MSKIKHMLLWQRGKEILGNLDLKKRRRTWLKCNAMGVRNMGTIGEIVLSSRRTITKEEDKKPTSPRKWRKLKRRNPRRRK